MKIVNGNSDLICYKDLKPGDVFKYPGCGRVLLKIKENNPCQGGGYVSAVNLTDNNLYHEPDPNHKVCLLPNAELHINSKGQ